MPNIPTSWLTNPGSISAFVVVVFILMALWSGQLVTKREHENVVRERDELRKASDAYLLAAQERDREDRRRLQDYEERDRLWTEQRRYRGKTEDS